MNITELNSYNLDDAVKFNDQLNPRLWDNREHLRPEVRERLLEIADDFREFLGVTDLAIKDITISGSNAAYTYTPNSDIDLHLVVDMPDNPVYRELFDAKKFQYNEQHDIKIGGADVELYVQDADKPHVSQGIYSILNNDWLQVPRRVRSVVDDTSTRNKFEKVGRQIESAIKSGNLKRITRLAEKIKKMRQTGLENHGEFGPENLAFKMLRSQGLIKQLYDARNTAKDREFSLKEKAVVPRTTYGFRTPTVVEADTVALEEASVPSDEAILKDFIGFCVAELKIKSMPTIKLRRDPQWPVTHTTFGRYINDQHLLEVAWGDRHIMDVLRTVAHELTHKHQHERDGKRMDSTAGETGSPWENEANARAGILMRDYARMHPEYFAVGQADDLHADEVHESASGYIPTKRQAKDPRYSMALTVDIKPGQVGREANKLKLKTDSQGHPQIANPNGLFEQLATELDHFKQQDLFEINMGSKNLRREAAKTGAIAGMEFEMIVPNVEGSGDEDLEPDYDMDERCRSIQDAYDFFYDGDYNSRRDCDRMREKMHEDYLEWLDDKIATDWTRGGEEYIAEWVKNNVDESVWNPDDLAGDARNEALEEYAANIHADPDSRDYESAYEEFREENQESYDESDWLDDADLDRMSYVEGSYSMNWPHWRSQGGGEANIEDVAQEFENAIGRDVRASGNYHSGSVIRPSPTQLRYVVEPDGSLEPDNSGDQGLEFVSPPLPIDEILGDLNKVRAWAKEYGCYTNDSTGLHINISVPDYSRQKLDFVKLALLMGDNYVLDAFGRAGNTYAKSALDIVKKAVRDNPDNAAKLLDKMKGNMDQLASKAIHSGITSKYTSINTKDGHIEFRSPGGDWLDENFDQIENTLLRFTVAMSAALDPDAYRQEYLTKLYKLLSDGNKDVDTIRYFSDYVAGKIPKAALRSFVKQAQLQRNIKRGKHDGQKMWWKVYKYGKNAGQYSYTVEVVATSEEEAKQKAAKEWGEPLLVNTLAQMDAEVLRPYDEQPDKPGATQTGTGTYELFDRRTGEVIPDTEFSARNQSDVNTRLDDYINFGPHGIGTVDARLVFGARPVGDADQGALPNSLRPTGPGPWEIYNRATGNSAANLSVDGRPITDRAQAQRMAMGSIAAENYDRFGVRTRGTESNSNWRIIYSATGETLNTVSGASRDQALAVLHDTARRNGVRPDVLSLQSAPASDDIPEVPVDVAQNFPQNRTDGRDTNYSFRDLFGNRYQTSSAPAGNSFSGQWKVMLDGEEVWRFRGVGNNQADANRIAQTWLQDQRSQGSLSPAPGADVEVVPIMTESVTESANPADTLYFFDVAKGGRSFDHLDLRIMGLRQTQKGRWYYQPGRDSTDLLTTATLKHLEKTLNVPARAWTKPVAETRIIDPEHVDVYYRPVPGSQGRRVVAQNIPVATLDALLQKLSDKYSVPVESFEWTPTEPITEAFDQPYTIQWSKQNGDWHATADLDDGSELIVLFMAQGDNSWMVEFERDENMEITGEGDAPRVFATVLTAMQQFIAKKKPARLNFSAEKEDDPTGSRARLYDRMLRRYVTGSGYDLARSDMPGGATYTLTKQAPAVAEGKVKLHTDPGYFGAEVDDTGFDSLPVVNIPANKLVGFEPDSKMNQPKSQANVEKIVAGLKKGDKLPPLLVRKYKNGYQVLDGHHRFWAYKLSGTKSIPVRIVADKDIEEIGKQGVAEGKLTESAIFLNPNTVIVGQQHGQPLELSPETLKKVQAIAAQHGAWYEGNGADRAYTRGVIDRYVGSFDDEVAKTASPNDPKWIYVLFANVDANNRIQRVGVDPKDTIFNRLMVTAQDNSFQGMGFTASALEKFLSLASEGKYDFVKMSQQPATEENLTQFLKAGEALMWPSNWEQYPNRAGKIARAATVDTRDQYLATRKAGVYVVGAGHLKAVQNISGKQGVAEGVDIGQEWMSDTELDQYVPDRLQQQWRELLGYDRNGNPSALWVNLTGGYEPDVRDPQHRALMVKVANKWFAAKKIPNVKFYDVKDADDELEWLVQIGQQDVAENFADGKGPGRPGDSQRHGIPKGATMAQLEKASHAKGRKGQLARWQLNMRRGHKK